MTGAEQTQALAVAAALGLLVGLERERSGGDTTLGIRTLPVLSVLGLLCQSLDVLPIGLAVAGALVVVSYVRSSALDRGLTTELAAVLVFLLGAVSRDRPALAAGVAVAVTALLAAKSPLHRFAQRVLRPQELTDGLQLLVAAFVLLPLLPAGAYGPYGIVDPRRIWGLVLLLTTLSGLGYVATRALGPRRGLLLSGVAGGFVSGVATTAVMARRARQPGLQRQALAAALAASLATLGQLALVVGAVDPPLLGAFAPGLLVGALVLAIETGWLARGSGGGSPPRADDGVRAFTWRPAVLLATVLTLVLLLSRWASAEFGPGAVVLTGAIGGAADVHATALVAATLRSAGDLATSTAVLAVGAALAVNTAVKLLAALSAGGLRIASRLGALLVLPVTGGLAAQLVSAAIV